MWPEVDFWWTQHWLHWKQLWHLENRAWYGAWLWHSHAHARRTQTPARNTWLMKRRKTDARWKLVNIDRCAEKARKGERTQASWLILHGTVTGRSFPIHDEATAAAQSSEAVLALAQVIASPSTGIVWHRVVNQWVIRGRRLTAPRCSLMLLCFWCCGDLRLTLDGSAYRATDVERLQCRISS